MSACAAATAAVRAQLDATWARVAAWALSGVLAIRVGAALVGVYSTVGPEGRDRLAKIRSAPAGSTLIIQTYSRPRSRYFMGEDLTSESLRGYVSEHLRGRGLRLDHDALEELRRIRPRFAAGGIRPQRR